MEGIFIDMRFFAKSAWFIFVLSLSLLLMSACIGTLNEYKVTYVYNNGDPDLTVSARVAEEPELPIKEGYEFEGWYQDESLTEPYTFGKALSGDITLFASWKIDYRELSNKISSEVSKACVKISSEFYSNPLFPDTQSQGSGVIYKNENGFYYILTNNHVVNKDKSYLTAAYTVYDAFGNKYDGMILYSDAHYDLAVICIKEDPRYMLSVLEFDEHVLEQNATVITVSAPKGQFNVISYGELAGYKSVDTSGVDGNTSDVTFDVYWHTSYSTSGSSGGALISTDLKLIGINYAIANDTDGNFMYSFAIPASKINEFLQKVD